jgi:hypothetical protein
MKFARLPLALVADAGPMRVIYADTAEMRTRAITSMHFSGNRRCFAARTALIAASMKVTD